MLPWVTGKEALDTQPWAPDPQQTLDRTAIGQLERLHGRLVPVGGREVLPFTEPRMQKFRDEFLRGFLMACWNSRLPMSPAYRAVSGLGLNREEMDANPRLGEKMALVLHMTTRLPFDDGRFDAVAYTVSDPIHAVQGEKQ